MLIPGDSVGVMRQNPVVYYPLKVFEHMVSVRLGRFMERSAVLPTTQFAYRKDLSTGDALMYVPYTAKCIGELAGGKDRVD